MNWTNSRLAAVATLLVTILGLISVSLNRVEARNESDEVSNQEVAAWIGEADAPLLLDVRSTREFDGGHIPGSVNIPHDQLASRIAEIAAHRDPGVIVYCERGGRARMASAVLEAEHFSSIRYMKGDMSGWRAAELPTEKNRD